MTGGGDPRIGYCTVEDVTSTVDIAPTATRWATVARHVLAASADIEGLLNRRFYPYTDVRYKDWPLNYQYAHPWRLWLDADEVWSLDRIVTGDTTLLPDRDFILRPENTGPPYSSVELRVESSSWWAARGGTWQQTVALHGVFGGCGDTTPAGVAIADVDDVATTVQLGDGSLVGTLDTIRVDDEWMTVTRRRMAPTGVTLTADVAAAPSATVLTVSGSTVVPDETLLLGGERVRVVDVSGATLVVRRAVDGTVLAAHPTGTPVLAVRALTVARGALGTSPAAHPAGTAVSRLAVPEPVRSLAVAEATRTVQVDSQGWTTDRGDAGRMTQFRDLTDLRNSVYTRWARQARIKAV